MSEQFHQHVQPTSVLNERPSDRDPNEWYADVTGKLAKRIVYGEKGLDIAEVERDLRIAMRIPKLEAVEREHHELEALLHLLKGIEAHEQANRIHGGAWQAELLEQRGQGEGHRFQPPETLTRTQVAKEFDAFELKDRLTKAELDALTHYESLLAAAGDEAIRLTANVSIQRTDIEVLINDIQVRIIEREPEEEKRKMGLRSLDRSLAEIVSRIPDAEWGKRYEMEEIYLLRRLIHAADTGHLASVSHGTPREDLNPERESVDVIVTAAGTVFGYQFKTLKSGVSWKTREHQVKIFAEAKERLEGTSTRLVALETEAIEKTFERSLRQPDIAQTSRADKYEALEPITEDLDKRERKCLLSLLGLTEQDLIAEQKLSGHRQEQRRQFEEEIRLKKEADQQKFDEAAALVEAQRLEQETIERERLDAIAKKKREADELAAQARFAAAELARGKQIQTEMHLLEAREREAELRRQREQLALDEQKKAERREAREAAKRNAPGWPPKNLVGISSSDLFMKMGLLPEDWKNDAPQLLAAKKRFFHLFAKTKRGEPTATDKSRPSDLFATAFPTMHSIKSPTDADIRRWREIVGA
jgi:hypothetical protein